MRHRAYLPLEKVKLLLSTLPHSIQPWKFHGHWRKPKISARRLAELRKSAVHHNVPWPLDETLRPDSELKRHGFLKIQKGHKPEREKLDILQKRVDALKTMRTKMLKLREENQVRRYKDPFDFLTTTKQ